MAHGIQATDTMFSVNETPWHKLGTVVDKAPTIGDAIRLAGLDWEVFTDRLQTQDGCKVDAYAVRRKDSRAVVGDSVGPKYRPLQNAEAFTWFQPFVDSGLASLETAGSLWDGRKVWVLARINRQDSEIMPGDSVAKFLLLSNSHDGTSAVRCGYTPIRVVCNNTLTIAHSDRAAALLRIRHTASMRDGLSKAQELIEAADTAFEETADLFRGLAKRSITGSEFNDYVKSTLELGTDDKGHLHTKGANILRTLVDNLCENQQITRELLAAHREREVVETEAHATVGASLLDSMLANLESGRGQAETQGPSGPTWWHAYNAVTEYLTHQRGKTAESRLDSSWFGSGAATNAKALQTALALSA